MTLAYDPERITLEMMEKPGAAQADALRKAIASRRARVGVIGLGYVGLPLGVAFANAGFGVLGFDIDVERIAAITEGRSYLRDLDSEAIERLVRNGQLGATSDMELLREMDVINISVPTPLSKTRDPDMSAVLAATAAVAKALRPGQLVILESTTYPGTTRELILPLLQATGLRCGDEFFLAFSPERIDPANREFTLQNTPKVVGGIDARSTELAVLIYEQVIDRVVAVSSPEAAEMTKLHENTFRSVNIALANETALMCSRLGIDVWEVIEAAATKPFGFMPFWPGPGIGGHCIPLDPFYLSWKMRTLNYRARFIELAGEINTGMPLHVVSKITAGLNDMERSVKGSDILILGVAYKREVHDVRESPALDIMLLLCEMGARVSYSDPYVPELELLGTTFRSESLTPERLARADGVVIVTDHLAFDYPLLGKHAKMIVDSRNAMRDITLVGQSIGL